MTLQSKTRRANSLTQAESLALSIYLEKAGVRDTDKDYGSSSKGELLSYRNELRRASNELGAKTKAELEKGPGKYNQAAVDANIEILNSIQALQTTLQTNIDLKDLVPGNAKSDNWRNSNGSILKVLNNSQSFSESVGERSEFGFGEYIQAMVSGTNKPEIRNALSEGTDSAGGYTVPRGLLAEVFDTLRAKSAAITAGALTLPLDTNLNTIVRVASDPVAGWRLENGLIAESDPTLDGVILQPRSMAVMVKISRELLTDSLNMENVLTTVFAGTAAAELDRVCFMGSGTAPEPRGIINQAGINVVSMGTNGAAITNYTQVLDALYQMQLANASDPGAMVMHPRTARVLNGFTDTTGQPLMPPPALSDVQRLATTNIPITQTQGTASNASSIFVGDFSQMIIGVRQELRIEILRERYAENHQYAFVMHLRADIALAQPKAFCVVKGIVP